MSLLNKVVQMLDIVAPLVSHCPHVFNKQEIEMIKHPKTKFIHARVNVETHEEFVAKAEPLGGVSAVIREWIEKFIKSN